MYVCIIILCFLVAYLASNSDKLEKRIDELEKRVDELEPCDEDE